MKSKFNFRKTSGRKYRKWKDWEEGDTFIGEFIETYIDDYDKNAYVFKCLESDFGWKEGETVVLNANGALEYNLAGISRGTIVQVVYEGVGIGEKGKYKGKEFHKLEVAIDDSHAVSQTPVDVEDVDL